MASARRPGAVRHREALAPAGRSIRHVRERLWYTSAIALLLLAGVSAPAIAQESSSGWSEPINLSNSPTESQRPTVAADPSGVVHVIWSEAGADSTSSLWYSRGKLDTWSNPVDILMSPSGTTASFPVLAAGTDGLLHVAWSGGGCVNYSQGYAPDAGSAKAWSTPQALSSSSSYAGDLDLDLSPSGDPVVAFAVQVGADSGVYVLRSVSGGAHWLVEQSIYNNIQADRMVDRPRLAIGPDGSFHVVWVEMAYPETFPPLGIWYSFSTDGGAVWSQPILLGEGPYEYPEILVSAGGDIHVVWSGTGVDRFKFHRWSTDGGLTWSETWRDRTMGGYQGLPALAADGNDVIHLLQVGSLYGNTDPSLNPDRLFEQIWMGDRWGEANTILTSEVLGQNMDFVSASVALGNELYVALMVPIATSEEWPFDIVVLHRALGASSVPARDLNRERPEPETTKALGASPAAEASGLSVSTEAAPQATSAPAGPRATGGFQPVALGAAAAALACAAVFGAVRLRRR